MGHSPWGRTESNTTERLTLLLPFPTPGNLPDPGIEPESLASSALAGRLFTTSATGNCLYIDSNLYLSI